jgi:hypothetical protein
LALARAKDVAAANGFTANYTDCAGVARTDGVTVAYPPTTGDFAGVLGYVQATVKRPMQTTFAAAVGQSCWMVGSDAVSRTAKYTTVTTTTTTPTPYPTIVALKTGCDATFHWNGHRGTIYGDIQSNGQIDNTGEPSNQVIDGTVVQKSGCPPSPHPLGTYTTETFADPFPWTLADFQCQAGGPEPGDWVINSTLPDGTYCANGKITVSKDGLTGRYTFIADQLIFSGSDMNLLPFEHGVLAWATTGVPCSGSDKGGGDGFNIKSPGTQWSGIIYSPCGDVHVTSKAGTVVDGNIWAWNLEMGGDDWSIRGLGAGTSTTSTTYEDVLQQDVTLVE